MGKTNTRTVKLTEKQLEAILDALQYYECNNHRRDNKSYELAAEKLNQALESIQGGNT